jgi:hypothetical protein
VAFSLNRLMSSSQSIWPSAFAAAISHISPSSVCVHTQIC